MKRILSVFLSVCLLALPLTAGPAARATYCEVSYNQHECGSFENNLGTLSGGANIDVLAMENAGYATGTAWVYCAGVNTTIYFAMVDLGTSVGIQINIDAGGFHIVSAQAVTDKATGANVGPTYAYYPEYNSYCDATVSVND